GMRREGEGFTPQMVLRGSLERLAPVLMTALTAGIGLVPLVVGGRKPGLEILYPVATVILGGLVTSTFCEFLIHPGLFWLFSGKEAERLAQDVGSDEELLRPERNGAGCSLCFSHAKGERDEEGDNVGPGAGAGSPSGSGLLPAEQQHNDLERQGVREERGSCARQRAQ